MKRLVLLLSLLCISPALAQSVVNVYTPKGSGQGSLVSGNIPVASGASGLADSGISASSVTTATNTQTLTNKTISGASNTLTAIPNGALVNSNLTIAGHVVSLGGTQALGCADLTGAAPSCSTDTTNAANITSGTLSNSRLSAIPNSALATPAPCSAFGTGAGSCAQGNDSRITGALQSSNNLSDLGSAATARTNLGLGSAGVLVTKTANYSATGAEGFIEANANGGAFTITVSPTVVNGRAPIRVRKIDTSTNAVSISDGTNVVFALTSAANSNGNLGGWCDVSSNGTNLRTEGIP